MGRGYWLPPQHDNLTASDGFYIDSSAVYADGINCWIPYRKGSFSEKKPLTSFVTGKPAIWDKAILFCSAIDM